MLAAMRLALGAALLVAAPAFAFDANGVGLGASEREVRTAFPSAHCKPLDWSSRAADRRCDDGRVAFSGARARITFYLKADRVQAFDLRFDVRDLDRLREQLRRRYGTPLAEATEVVGRAGDGERRVFKMRWEKGADRAVLSAPLGRKRGTLEVWRGDFQEEIYRVR